MSEIHRQEVGQVAAEAAQACTQKLQEDARHAPADSGGGAKIQRALSEGATKGAETQHSKDALGGAAAAAAGCTEKLQRDANHAPANSGGGEKKAPNVPKCEGDGSKK